MISLEQDLMPDIYGLGSIQASFITNSKISTHSLGRGGFIAYKIIHLGQWRIYSTVSIFRQNSKHYNFKCSIIEKSLNYLKYTQLKNVSAKKSSPFIRAGALHTFTTRRVTMNRKYYTFLAVIGKDGA